MTDYWPFDESFFEDKTPIEQILAEVAMEVNEKTRARISLVYRESDSRTIDVFLRDNQSKKSTGLFSIFKSENGPYPVYVRQEIPPHLIHHEPFYEFVSESPSELRKSLSKVMFTDTTKIRLVNLVSSPAQAS